MDKQGTKKEYELMLSSLKQDIRVYVPGGPVINAKVWDLVNELTKTSFKTLSNIKSSKNVKVENLDLLPWTTKKAYKVTVFKTK